MADYLKNIAFCGGVVVIVVVDRDEQPDCKRDSWGRIKARELDDVNQGYFQMKSMTLYHKVVNHTASVKEKKTYEKLGKAVKTFEKRCSKSHFQIPSDFFLLITTLVILPYAQSVVAFK